jgi:hypothetical protein
MSDIKNLQGQENPSQVFSPPKGYEPFESVNYCGLRAVNVRYFVEAEGFPPLLVGKGRSPQVWLAKLTEDPHEPWQWAVSGNIAEDPAFKVRTDDIKRSVTVKRRGIPIITARVGPFNTLTVDYIDLRPIGIYIHGENGALFACDNKMSNCAYMNVENVFDIGPPPKN